MLNHLSSPIAIAALAYLAGSINFAILLFMLLGKEDPRKGYSGNPGATNVYRQAGLPWAIVVLLFDMGRAVAVAFAAVHFLNDVYITWIGFCLILGNRFPCFHGFKGGKGVANFLGFSVVLTYWAALVSGITWIAVNLATRKPFVASFAMVTVLTIGTILIFKEHISAIIGTLLTAFVIVAGHKKNVIDAFAQSRQKEHV